MKKSKKLLSVLLAVLMALSSMTVLASAANFEYKTSAGLEAVNAYSPYGQVTRLNTEERVGMVLDMLDDLLSGVDIHIEQDLVLTKLYVDFSSVDNLCDSLESFADLLPIATNVIVSGILSLFGGLGDLKSANLNSWPDGLTRTSKNSKQNGDEAIVRALLVLLSQNTTLVRNILNKGSIDLGLIGSAANLDLSAVEGYLKDIPGLIKGLIYPMLERKDDTTAWADKLADTSNGVVDILNTFVQNLFKNPQSTTTYKEDASGNVTSNHKLPEESDGLRYYYVKNGNGDGATITAYVYTPGSGYKAEDPFTRKEEVEGSGVYIYAKANGETLKYYDKDSYWLPALKDKTIDLTSTSAAQLLYDFIPPVFAAMAPVVVNGSLKKLFAELLGVTFEPIGTISDDSAKSLGLSDEFLDPDASYLWEYTAYEIVDGTPYYRYEEKLFKGDTTGVNAFYELINWEWKITDDFINEFVPKGTDLTDESKSDAGYTTVLQGLNDFLVKVANELMSETLKSQITLETGDNSKLIGNIKKAAQIIVGEYKEELFGEDYEETMPYYDLIMSKDDQEILLGIACTVIPMLMPQLILPSAENVKGQKVGAILAAVIRELATQLIPNHNYDALIYSNYNEKTFVAGRTNEDWLNVILTIGTDIGVYYLKALADMGEDSDAWKTGMPYNDKETYKSDDDMKSGSIFKWEARVDYIVDWALDTNEDWTWHFERFVNTGDDVDLATPQSPWVKLSTILGGILPLDQIFTEGTLTDSEWVKTVLKDKLVLGIAELDLKRITDLLIIPKGSVLRQDDVFTQLATVVKDLLNGLLKKVAEGDLIPSSITTFDELLSKNGIMDLVDSLLTKLPTAYDNGLLDPVLPILGFFVGWKTDSQVYADPTVTLTPDSGLEYLLASGGSATATITVKNDASGMLEKHRKDKSYDYDYVLKIEDVRAADGTNITVNDTSNIGTTLNPGYGTTIPITVSGNDQAVTVYIDYSLTGKDGEKLGGKQTEVVHQYITETTYTSSQADTHNFRATHTTSGISTTDVNVNSEAYDTVIVTDNLAAAAANFYIRFTNSMDNAQWIKTGSTNGGNDYPIAFANTDWIIGANDGSVPDDENTYPGHLRATGKDYYAPSDIHFLTTSAFSRDDIPSGSILNSGSVTLAWGRGDYVADAYTYTLPQFYFYNVDDLSSALNSSYYAQRSDYAEGTDVDALWNTFVADQSEALKLVLGPKTNVEADFVSTYSAENLKEKADALRDAYEALAEHRFVPNTVDVLETSRDAHQNDDNGVEINFQDYELYEYFKYQDYRTDVRNRIKEYYPPDKPEKYFPDSSLVGAAVDAFLATVDDDNKKAVLTADVKDPDMDAYYAALAEFVDPSYTALDNEDMAAKLGYYKKFLIAKTTEKQFLQKELDYVAYKNYQEADYSVDSWKAYTEALDNANTVNNDGSALQSAVFDAKYALMKAENELLLRERSAKDANDGEALAHLKELVATAEKIFASFKANDGEWAVKEDVDQNGAFAQLLKALGYKTNDGEILYAGSALTFLEYDRETTANNLAKIAAAEAALEAAIANFELNAEPEIVTREEHHDNDDVPYDPSQAHDGVIDDKRGLTDDNDGYLYGIEIGQDILQVFHTETGMLEVIPNDLGVKNGTGAKVQLKTADGTRVIKTFTVIIFGDVNGDGIADSTDASLIDQGVSSTSTLNDVQLFAGDLDGNDYSDSTDSSYILQSVASPSIKLPSNPYPTTV